MSCYAAAALAGPYASTQSPPSSARVLQWGIPALLIVASFLSLKPNSTFLQRHIVLLGDASYAIYLTPLGHDLLRLAPQRRPDAPPTRPIIPIVVVLCAGFGVLIHVFVERGLIEGVRGLFSRQLASPLGASPIPSEIPEAPAQTPDWPTCI